MEAWRPVSIRVAQPLRERHSRMADQRGDPHPRSGSLGFGGVPTLLGLVERLLIVLNALWLALAAAAVSEADAVRAARRAVVGGERR
ncbi:hypothetical protein [Dactylosporangium matsuzakiense]|uniref:hypothetical protein n=1 Tax=Dactylosporangium matsuzakiense TaxID=53360 RepID=UPI0022F2B7EC|nr:hypothetical protein [Dactylosporangium matsuzakiense]